MPTMPDPRHDPLPPLSAAREHAALFTPTVTADDDAVGFDRPWNPYSIVFVTFFAGILGGGMLFALNSRRLGVTGRMWRLIGLTVAVTVVLDLAVVLLIGCDVVDMASDRDRRLLDFGTRAVAVLTALALAATQAKRFRLAQYDHATGALWWPGITAVVAGTIVQKAVLELTTGHDFFP